MSNIPVPDGTSCSGADVCTAGECSVQGAVFSEDFAQFDTSTQQCDSCNDFLDNRLSAGNYIRVR